MQALLNKFVRRADSKTVVGVELRRNGVALVAQHWRKNMPSVFSADFISMDNLDALESVMKAWVDTNKLNSATCNLVLNSDNYQILLVEPPEVPETEIRSAIRWRLKDLISLPPDKVSIDVFPLPQDGTKANKKMVYVVVTETEKLKRLIDTVLSVGLHLNAVDICELAIRNIASRILPDADSDRGIAVARIRQGIGSVYIFRHGNMYLARSFALDYNAGLMDDLPQENLALELQRSLDYFERQMGQAPPSVIYVCGDHISEDKVGATLKASLSIPIKTLDLSSVCSLNEDCPTETLSQCIGALGGALRREDV